MKSKTTLVKTIKTFIIIFALAFSTNSHATGWWWNWWSNWSHKHYRGCGHSGYGGDNGGDSIPLDGGVGILLLGAAAFGVSKLRKKNNDKI